jgi:hypothetical protein
MSGAIIAAHVVRARKRIVAAFEDASATSPERAIAYVPPARRIAKRVFRRLVAHGALVEAKPGRYYLDRDRLADYRSKMRGRVAGMLALAAAAVGAAVALGG